MSPAIPLVILIFLATTFDLRQFLPNVSPALIEILTFGLEDPLIGSLVLIDRLRCVGAGCSRYIPDPGSFQRSDPDGVLWTLVIGLFSEFLSERIRSWFGVGVIALDLQRQGAQAHRSLDHLHLDHAPSLPGGKRKEIAVKERYAARTAGREKTVRAQFHVVAGVLLIVLPLLLGNYLSEVTNNVLIYVLMGFGSEYCGRFCRPARPGLRGFLRYRRLHDGIADLHQRPRGLPDMSFWAALPICVLVAVLFGIMLGIPVLRMRGDYLAIVTLGFGEIIRILALSDLLKPYIGGAQGILQIHKPTVIGLGLVEPTQFYYVVLAGCLLAAFVSWRLSGVSPGAPVDGVARRRRRGRSHGHQPGEHQTAGLRHRRSFLRALRRHLRQQADLDLSPQLQPACFDQRAYV